MIETQLLEEARAFIRQSYDEMGLSEEEAVLRIAEIERETRACGTYTHTAEELAYGAKLAWRNSNRCIGRLFWESLVVRDARHLTEEDAMAEACFAHLRQATGEGAIRPVITVFAPADRAGGGPRIWNHQLIRYAGYASEDGTVRGDPASAELTRICTAIGWEGQGGHFDVLPLVLQAAPDRHPRWYTLPADAVLEVPLVHPEIPAISELGLRWYAVPIIADMRLEIGGIVYPAAPFNGWYMGTEIGARNLADRQRYDKLPEIARAMGLRTDSETTLWRDRALVELNVAVLHGFREAGVTIVDHHTAARQFAHFEAREQRSGREVTGRWSWLVPPLSPATTDVFHRSYPDIERRPAFTYQAPAYARADCPGEAQSISDTVERQGGCPASGQAERSEGFERALEEEAFCPATGKRLD
ncbi:nitric oxide synthase oxygenase [Paenibacillus sp. IB182496]|uniref:Nitric oxide synthase oxygenase n=1 Tax=Paenibacillus sabuli TaxID=2772509 RepID=A0A927BW87_9BACL|nr:nitric oxide synthase oxygenase [Paenibacillus sabuli]MBD2846890.1 nitric oxide synthase oxygenase [Paenibacillus sabuli]